MREPIQDGRYNIAAQFEDFMAAAYPGLPPSSSQAKDCRKVWFASAVSLFDVYCKAARLPDEEAVALIADLSAQIDAFQAAGYDAPQQCSCAGCTFEALFFPVLKLVPASEEAEIPAIARLNIVVCPLHANRLKLKDLTTPESWEALCRGFDKGGLPRPDRARSWVEFLPLSESHKFPL